MNKNKFYQFTAAAQDAPARLDLFGSVGGGFWDQGFDESSFKADMAVVRDDQPLNVYINSMGGSVYTGIAIYNLISRHKGPVTITVAGMAASAATIITSARGAKVVMPRGSMMLVHPVRMSTDALTPREMKEAAENLEKVRLSVRDIYSEKTGLDEKTLDKLMNAESFLTAEEAVELGFADEIDESQVVENRAVGDAVMVNNLKVSAQFFANAPEGFIHAEEPKASAVQKKEVQKMNLETLKAEHPELVQAIRNEAMVEGAAQERARIQAIEDIAVVGHENLVNDAKFDGKTTAEALAVQILKADKARGAQMLKDRKSDAKALEGIESEGNEGLDPKAEAKAKLDAEMKAAIEAGARAFARK